MERIISDECLQSIMRACYAAGMHRRDLYTVRGPDGPEVVRCKDCKSRDEWIPDGAICGEDPDGYCAWGERA